MTSQVIESVYPEINRDLKSCLTRFSTLVGIREFFWRRRELHFDRIPYASHQSTWDIGVLEIRYRLMKYRWFYKRGRIRRACREIGILILMLEEFFCHTNIFDLPQGAKDKVTYALIRLEPYPQMDDASLMFTSYSPFQGLLRRDDGYSHSRTIRRYPSEQELQLIALTVKKLFSHYGIIV